MLLSYVLGQNNIILRVKVANSSLGNNIGVVNVTNTTANLVISTIADNESVAVSYSSALSTIDTIATLGTYATPTSGQCRWRQVDQVRPARA